MDLTFKELLLKSDKEKVLKKLASIDRGISKTNKDFNLENQLKGYGAVYDTLLEKKESRSTMTIFVESVKNDPVNDGKTWHGHVYCRFKNRIYPYALLGIYWKKILGSRVCSNYSTNNTVAYIVWEMTYSGFCEKDIMETIKKHLS